VGSNPTPGIRGAVHTCANVRSVQELRRVQALVDLGLNDCAETQINLPFITAVESVPKHLNQRLTRSKLNDLTAELVDRVVGRRLPGASQTWCLPTDDHTRREISGHRLGVPRGDRSRDAEGACWHAVPLWRHMCLGS
jgi:hypothetical protein